MVWERFCDQCAQEPVFCRCQDCECPKRDSAGYEDILVDAAERLICAVELFLEQEPWKWGGRRCIPYPDPIYPPRERKPPQPDTET